ncbi:hypothetical protein D8Y20_10260 [Mariprofundus sp. EBB-1]|uniref:hypothetical protein n=1 Tax=Mariprofundus sp. EBB-1 TaxID=2650971 RepID=UPI000EF1B58D|nr:hypothetical protein [Mariprofundus sp. EBB-1]RLL51103.1 hypothetical protein D8Y20_10260 [Mariprofundus sp. EBB-1]
MKHYFLNGVLALLLIFTSAGYAYAVDILASHQILSVQPTASGNDITINLVLSNISAQNINYITVDQNDSTWQINAATTLPLKLGAIIAGGALANTWQLNTSLSSFDGTLPLTIHLFYEDANGAPVDIDIISVAR